MLVDKGFLEREVIVEALVSPPRVELDGAELLDPDVVDVECGKKPCSRLFGAKKQLNLVDFLGSIRTRTPPERERD